MLLTEYIKFACFDSSQHSKKDKAKATKIIKVFNNGVIYHSSNYRLSQKFIYIKWETSFCLFTCFCKKNI